MTEKQEKVRKRNFAIFRAKSMIKNLEQIKQSCTKLSIIVAIERTQRSINSIIHEVKDTSYESWTTP